MGQYVFQLLPEQKDDMWEVEALYDLCFAPGREVLSSYRLRDGVDPVFDLCTIARDRGGILAGAIRYWPVRICDGGNVVSDRPVLLLGPVAVHPTHQGEGLGGMLIEQSLTRAKSLGWTWVILVGDAPYYGRFGFEKLPLLTMPPPTNPDRILGRALRSPNWDGPKGRVIPFGVKSRLDHRSHRFGGL